MKEDCTSCRYYKDNYCTVDFEGPKDTIGTSIVVAVPIRIYMEEPINDCDNWASLEEYKVSHKDW